ncbi:MAG TPA: hypothetical protein VM053_06740 [Gemmatimonadaceae bacterium]|nr:hypothetical protein [Gemmatimonadaceae bacterium]
MGDRQERALKLKEEIRNRLEGVCSNLSPEEFQKLIDQIADNQLKGEFRPFRIMSPIRPDSGATGLKPTARPHRSA